MKTIRQLILILSLAAVAVAADIALSAVSPVIWTQQYIYSNTIGTNPIYAGSATPTSAPFQCLFWANLTSNETPPKTTNIQLKVLNFDMIDPAHAGLKVTYNGVTQTYATVYGLLNQAMIDQFNKQ